MDHSDIDPALVLNEAEVLTEDVLPEEPDEETITYKRKKRKGKREEGVVKADRPNRLFTRSLLTPSLAAAIFNGKYVNAIPLNRISEDMLRHDVRISRQVMAGWMIRITAIYHVENMCKDSPEAERLKHRQDSVKPLVDAYFEWLSSIDTSTLDKSGNLPGLMA